MGQDQKVIVVKIAMDKVPSYRTITIPYHATARELTIIGISIFDLGICHLYQIFNNKYDSPAACYEGYIVPRKEDFYEPIVPFPHPLTRLQKMWEVCLPFLLPAPGKKVRLRYDFDDDWTFTVTRMADPKKPTEPYRCLKSVGPDGIEDCGGPKTLLGLMNLFKKYVQSGLANLDQEFQDLIAYALQIEEDQLGDKPSDAHTRVSKKITAFLYGPSREEVDDRIDDAVYNVRGSEMDPLLGTTVPYDTTDLFPDLEDFDDDDDY